MSRIANAWRALMGAEPRVVTKTVTEKLLGDAVEVTLYVATSYECLGMYGGYNRALAYYTTCQAAHAAHPGKQIVATKAWKVGRLYVDGLKVYEVNVQKPKRAKGAK